MGTLKTEQTLEDLAKLSLDKSDKEHLLLRALLVVLTTEINTLRALHSLPDRTGAQMKTAIKNKIDLGEAS